MRRARGAEIFLDASAALDLLLNTPAVLRVAARVLAPRGEGTLKDLADLLLARYPHQLLLPRIWGLGANATA